MTLDISQYDNLLDSITFNSEDIEKTILNYKLVFDQYKNEDVEWRMKLPMFVDSFYAEVIKNQKVPSQNELFETYINQTSIQEILNKSPEKRADLTRGIKARLYRSYPSLVRDLHFSLFLKENARESTQIIYNIELDVTIGIDILV